MTAPAVDAWPLLRAAVASAAISHWRALRKMAPEPDPRCVAGEAVAATACVLMQNPAIWEAAHLLALVLGGDIRALERTTLTEPELSQLARQLETLDHTSAAWAASAYGLAAKSEATAWRFANDV